MNLPTLYLLPSQEHGQKGDSGPPEAHGAAGGTADGTAEEGEEEEDDYDNPEHATENTTTKVMLVGGMFLGMRVRNMPCLNGVALICFLILDEITYLILASALGS